jgi:DTW domain-containing protein YfiP
MRHQTTSPRCPKCRLKPDICMCALLPRIATRTHVDVVMHGLEQRKSTNTGALALTVFASSTLHLFGNDLPKLQDDVWPAGRTPIVLFPVAGAQPVHEFKDVVDTLALVVLDANWRQANRLRKRFAARNIPFVSVEAKGEYKLRNSPHEGGLSTFESIVHALAALEPDRVDVDAALAAFRVWQDRLLWTRGTIATGAVEGGIPEGARRT